MATDFFQDVSGNEGVKRHLSQLVAAKRVPHAVMFEGKNGSGKLKLALALAKILLCDSKTGCGICRNCRLVKASSHPDLTVYEPDRAVFTVDTVRRIIADAALKPFAAAVRVIILKNCDLMTREAQNAFLKTLEEPPAAVRFILLTQNAGAMLDTVRSRCAIFSFTDESAGDNKPAFDFGNLLNLASAGKESDLQAALYPLEKEKDRGKILEFFEQFEAFTAEAARNTAINGTREYGWASDALAALYGVASKIAEMLKQNGNKSLSLTLFAAEAVRLGAGKQTLPVRKGAAAG